MKYFRFIHIIIILILIASINVSLFAQEEKKSEDLYTVKKGDTLWDISSTFLKNPFLWPKLWQRNPFISNPHWIYPGQQIRLSPIEELKKAEEIQPREEPQKEALGEKAKEKIVEAEVKKIETPPAEKKQEVVVGMRPSEEKPSEAKPPFSPETRFAGFLNENELQGIGIILGSKEGKNLMSQEDIVYLTFKTSESVKIGDKFTVFRAVEDIKHPLTDQKIGKKVSIIGNIRIIDNNGKFFTAKILEVFDAMRKGDQIHPYMKERMEGKGK